MTHSSAPTLHTKLARALPLALCIAEVCIAAVGIAAVGIAAVGMMPTTAHAAGYDSPITYPARHVGMGGTAVSHVAGPSALAHNPAGLGLVDTASILGNMTLLMGHVRGSPEEDTNVRSNLLVGPFFLLGGALRLHELVTAGVAVYPVAAAGGSYEYDGVAGRTTDETAALFMEASPGLALSLPWGIRVGAGYRVTYVQINRRRQGANASGPGLDLSPSGFNFASFRVGAQWQPIDEVGDDPAARRSLQYGFTYRHRTEVDVSADEGIALAQPVTNIETSLVLAPKLSWGVRGDIGRVGASVELDYTFTSVNDTAALSVELDGSPFEIPNVFGWEDHATFRSGIEYRLLDAEQLALRSGFIIDGTATSPTYPTPFGSPPAPTFVITAGVGLKLDGWAANLAYGHRFGGTDVSDRDLEGAELCAFCGRAGEYSMSFHAISADVSYDFD